MKPRRIDGAERLWESAQSGVEPRVEQSLVAIGNFDGVHKGHQAVLRSACAAARTLGLTPLVYTFFPHPSEVLGRASLPVLTPLERKVDLITRLDPEILVVVEPFTLDLAKLSPRQFVEELLVGRLRAKVVLVGENFRFGRERAGDLTTLRALGDELGLAARAEPLTGDDAGAFSSTRVREAITSGDVRGAHALLGRPHALSGQIVRGDQRGRTLGFPTANFAAVAEALPPFGVYACVADLKRGAASYRALAKGVLNIGVRPTVAGGFSVEVHLLDFDGDLYDASLRVHLVERLRGEQRFDGLDALKAQIARDVTETRRLLERVLPDPGADGAWF